MKIQQAIRKLLFGHRSSSQAYIDYLREKGADIGDNVFIFAPNKTTIDDQQPHMLSIGSNVNMTGPVTILTHDYSTIACKEIVGGGIVGCGNVRPVVIGNNVFLGWGCTVLAGTVIGNNVIVGAGAVVTGKVESNSVYAGNPARRIMSIEEYLEKRRAKQLSEAVMFVNRYTARYGEDPDEVKLGHYARLYQQDATNFTCEYEDQIIKLPFLSKKDFLQFCKKHEL